MAGFLTLRNLQKVLYQKPYGDTQNIINKLTDNTYVNSHLHFLDSFRSSRQLIGSTLLRKYSLVKSQCFALSFFLTLELGKPARGINRIVAILYIQIFVSLTAPNKSIDVFGIHPKYFAQELGPTLIF